MRRAEDFAQDFVLKKMGRMPETAEEIDKFLDLINHIKEYMQSLAIEQGIGESFMKKLGFKTPAELRQEGEMQFGGYFKKKCNQ